MLQWICSFEHSALELVQKCGKKDKATNVVIEQASDFEMNAETELQAAVTEQRVARVHGNSCTRPSRY
jgi:hypothetical protein